MVLCHDSRLTQRRSCKLSGVFQRTKSPSPRISSTLKDFKRLPKRIESTGRAHHTTVHLDDLRHLAEVHVEEGEQVGLGEHLGDAREATDVREHDGDVPAPHVDPGGPLVPMQDGSHHRLRQETGEGLDGSRQVHEADLQLADLPKKVMNS